MKAFKITKIRGGVTTPLGFRANGVYCGIKPAYPGQKSSNSKRDLALIYSEAPAVTAGFFTTNQIQAAPVKICKEFLKKNKKNTRAIIVNSGNANCCTGKQGFQTAWGTAVAAASKLNLKKPEVLLASTGIIGRQLPGDKIYKALDELINGLSASLRAGAMAAEAIMTTDTIKKEAGCKIKIGRQTITIGGMAKG
ncbi:MAG: bifunctional ornithine acetyltransferase/N-acetylglutamate synthase, partial [Candidatus Omnitrophica bacterium]|nr:bifunctional ornithine acetyltransferase/N-acetylglutamate synthase [Candidatus Omnitrophota bacterium]